MSSENMRPFIGLNSIFMTLPEVDEHGTPKDKMPYCPRCSDDELSMLGMYAFCNRCNLKIYPIRKFECEHKYIENMGKPNQVIKCDLSRTPPSGWEEVKNKHYSDGEDSIPE